MKMSSARIASWSRASSGRKKTPAISDWPAREASGSPRQRLERAGPQGDDDRTLPRQRQEEARLAVVDPAAGDAVLHRRRREMAGRPRQAQERGLASEVDRGHLVLQQRLPGIGGQQARR